WASWGERQQEDQGMSKVRVLVGTRKGAFVLEADGQRKKWVVSGPHFPGWEVYHVKGSSADPQRLFASQNNGWFGQVIQRSDDGGKTWHQPGTPPGEPQKPPSGTAKGESNKFAYDASTEDSGRTTSLTRTLRSATAFTASRCTPPDRMSCSCRSTGMSCAVTMRATPGGK